MEGHEFEIKFLSTQHIAEEAKLSMPISSKIMKGPRQNLNFANVRGASETFPVADPLKEHLVPDRNPSNFYV